MLRSARDADVSDKDPENSGGKVIPLFSGVETEGPRARSVEAGVPDVTPGEIPLVDDSAGVCGDLFTAAQVERLLGVSVNRLRYWARIGLVEPAGRRGQRRCYTFQDLVSLRVVLELLGEGLATRKLIRAVERLRQQLPQHSSPFSELRVSCDGDAVVVTRDKPFEADTGQLLLDFSVGDLEDHVVRLVHPGRRADARERRCAFDWYLEGCRYEGDPEARDKAESSYRRAIELDPRLACAYTNLGNMRYRAGAAEDARVLYEKALELEPDQPEAHYNLGFLSFEEGEPADAIPRFERAIELDPDFGDAHFNLAMALEEVGRMESARPHFAAYLALEPEGPWAELARRHLTRPDRP